MTVKQHTVKPCNRSHFLRQSKTLTSFLICINLCFFTSACSFIKNPLLGQWVNTTNGNKVLLVLNKNEQCSLTLERLLQPPRTVECEYRIDDKNNNAKIITHSVYLKGADGQCDLDPDFSFTWQTENKTIQFLTGGAPIELHKL